MRKFSKDEIENILHNIFYRDLNNPPRRIVMYVTGTEKQMESFMKDFGEIIKEQANVLLNSIKNGK